MSQPGKFIVIDGTDGSGKTTQIKILEEKLKAAGCDVAMADFPQYGQKSAGVIEEYLSGKYGQAEEVGPYRASIFYAIDRFDASFKIKQWLNEGKIVLSNRYVSANMAHQGGKINSAIERKIYFNWLHDLEYNIFAIPRPDAVLILHVPAEISQKLTQNQDAIERKPEYTKKGKDIHETNLDHLKKAEEVYLEIGEMFSDFDLIECSANDEIMSREDISAKIWQQVDKIIKK